MVKTTFTSAISKEFQLFYKKLNTASGFTHTDNTFINNNYNSSNFKCKHIDGLFQNVRGLRTKLDLLRINEPLFTLDFYVPNC